MMTTNVVPGNQRNVVPVSTGKIYNLSGLVWSGLVFGCALVMRCRAGLLRTRSLSPALCGYHIKLNLYVKCYKMLYLLGGHHYPMGEDRSDEHRAREPPVEINYFSSGSRTLQGFEGLGRGVRHGVMGVQ